MTGTSVRTPSCCLVALTIATAVGCGPHAPGHGSAKAQAGDVPLAGHRLTIERSGGLAGLVTTMMIDGAGPSYLAVTRRPCAAEPCPPIDSASGPLGTDGARAVFARLDSVGVFALRDDYGRTAHAADMYAYVVRVRAGARTKQVAGDDGTLPRSLADVLGTAEQLVREARGQ
jgi:hypothetical protein